VCKRNWPLPTLQKHIPQYNHAQLGERYSNNTELLIQESAMRKTPSTEEDTLHSWITDAFNWMQQQYAHTAHWTAQSISLWKQTAFWVLQ